MGNLGTSNMACNKVNIASGQRSVFLSCQYGTLSELTHFGIQKTHNQTCTKAFDTFIGEENKDSDLQWDCDFDRGMTPVGQKYLEVMFNNECKGNKTCELYFGTSWFSRECRQRLEYYSLHSKFNNYSAKRNQTKQHFFDRRIREPIIFAVAFCKADEIIGWNVSKADFLRVIVAIDFVSIILLLIYLVFIRFRYKQFAEIFDKRNIEMQDFTIEVTNIPNDYMYGGKRIQL